MLFFFNGEEIKIECYDDSKIYDVAKKFTRKIGKDINSLYFIYKGEMLDLSKNFKELEGKESVLKIFVCEKNFEEYQKRPVIKEPSNKKVGTEDGSVVNKKCKVYFTFIGEVIIMECNYDRKMIDVAKNFASKIGEDINSLIFLYEVWCWIYPKILKN